MTADPSGPWEVLRRQVALCGRVTSVDTDQAIDGAEVRIVEGTGAVSRAADVRPNGVYFFLDLPAGRYVVAGEDPSGRWRGGGSAEVSWDEKGDVRRAVVDLELKAVVARAAVAERPRRRDPRDQ